MAAHALCPRSFLGPVLQSHHRHAPWPRFVTVCGVRAARGRLVGCAPLATANRARVHSLFYHKQCRRMLPPPPSARCPPRTPSRAWSCRRASPMRPACTRSRAECACSAAARTWPPTTRTWRASTSSAAAIVKTAAAAAAAAIGGGGGRRGRGRAGGQAAADARRPRRRSGGGRRRVARAGGGRLARTHNVYSVLHNVAPIEAPTALMEYLKDSMHGEDDSEGSP